MFYGFITNQIKLSTVGKLMQNKILKIVNFKYERKIIIQIALLNVDRRLFSIELIILKLDAFLSEIFNKS